MVISAPELPSADFLRILEQSYRGIPVAEPEGLCWEQESRRWGIPLQRYDGVLQLVHPEQAWDADRLAADCGFSAEQVAVWPLCDSSNTRLLAQPTLRFGLAEAQWSGHRRHGRIWHSGFGRHLAASFALEIDPNYATVLPLVAALGIYTILRERLPELWVKWPNDLWIGQRKVAGLLLEGRHGPAGQRWVLGFGVNVQADPGLPGTAISLAEAGCQITRHELLLAILAQWRQDLPLLQQGGMAPFRRRWEKADRLRGRWVELCSDHSNAIWQVEDVEDDGRLRLADGQRNLRIHAGQLRLRPLT